MIEVTLTFENQQQANEAVVALSHGCKVEQFYMPIATTSKPYCVKAYVPNKQITEVET